MAKETVTKRCSLCFEDHSSTNGGDLICYDSLQLCKNCYDRFTASAYNQRVMLINSIKCYRRLIMQYENCSNTKFDTKFNI